VRKRKTHLIAGIKGPFAISRKKLRTPREDFKKGGSGGLNQPLLAYLCQLRRDKRGSRFFFEEVTLAWREGVSLFAKADEVGSHNRSCGKRALEKSVRQGPLNSLVEIARAARSISLEGRKANWSRKKYFSFRKDTLRDPYGKRECPQEEIGVVE